MADAITPGSVQLLAENLCTEFSAPIGIFDADHRTWRAIVGATEACFPKADGQLTQVAASTDLRLGKVALWRPTETPQLVWLVLPLRGAEAADLVAFAGFHAPAGTSREANSVSEALAGNAGDAVTWGPACPNAALRAWGQQTVNGLRNDQQSPSFPAQPAVGTDQGGEHIVIGRLIRRMRISDHPARFQALATNVLKASLRVAAVAWVPREPHEAVVVSGEIEGLRSSSCRSLVSTDTRDSAYLINNEPGPRSPGTRFVSRYVSVPVGSRGWLVAVNPLPDRPIGTAEIERMQYVASLISAQFSNARVYGELKDLLFGIPRALTAAIDAKDPYTCGHSERVARIAVRLATELGIPAQKRSDLYLTGLLHDVGKIGVEDDVLKKPGQLTSDEYRKAQAHVEIGVAILRDLRKLNHILPGIRHHHERMDGLGYPDHLSGQAIPLEARILAVADSFDAMSSNRPYRKHLSPIQVDEAFHKGRGSQWDPKVVDVLFSCRMELEAIRQERSSENVIRTVMPMSPPGSVSGE